MHVIGTAGHVDHGKSSLVHALTGTDPDRLREEKERGMTIELGFALLGLPSGGEAGIVDVPGHERFIKTMLAGVGGIDLALLVVAADEGVMPQTREHLAIIDLLGIGHGVVGLTKADLVDGARVADAKAEVRQLLTGTALTDAPLVVCSATSGAGLPELLSAIAAGLSELPAPRDLGRPRLPIDRAFTMPGFGTVVTGTLTGGSLSVGDEVEIVPGGQRARIRGLQNHNRVVDAAAPGTRTAINLAGIAVEDVRRGMVVAPPGAVRAVTSVDVRLCVVPYLERPVRHHIEVTLHTGAAEAVGRLLLLDSDELTAGESGWAQVRLAEPMAMLPGDPFVIRDPNDTLGGGVIFAVDPPRHRRFHAETVSELERLLAPSPLAGLADASAAITIAVQRAEAALSEYHAAHPARAGMPREELRSRLGMAARGFDAFVTALAESGRVFVSGAFVSLSSHLPAISEAQQRAADAYLASLRASPYAPPLDSRPDAETMAYLEATGQIVSAAEVVFAANAYAAMVESITNQLRERGSATLAEVRDMFGTSRRYAQAVLERMDAERLTRRVGDARVLR